MPITVRSAPSKRRIEMAAQRLSIWGALRQISSMNAKNTASRRGDRWVAFSSHQAAAAARKDTYYHQQRVSGAQSTTRVPVSTLAPLHLSSYPDTWWERERNLHRALWQTIAEKN